MMRRVVTGAVAIALLLAVGSAAHAGAG